MTALRDKAAVTDRLRRALIAFQAAQTLVLGAYRKAKALASPEESEQFWARSGGRIEAQQRAAAMEVVAVFNPDFPDDWHCAGANRRNLV